MSSNIAKISDNPIFSELESTVVKASLAPMVVRSKESDIKNAITSGVTNALYNLGQSIETIEERQILESKILYDIKFHFKALTIKDIEIAFELGSKGFFRVKPDEVLYLSPERVCTWMFAFRKSIKEKTNQKYLQQLMKEEKAKELTPEEKEKRIILFLKIEVVHEFYNYKKSKSLNDPVGAIYDTLDKFKIINYTLERKNQIHERSIKILSRVLKGKDLKEFRERSPIGKVKIKNLSKYIALKEYFDGLIDMNVPIEDMINEKVNTITQ